MSGAGNSIGGIAFEWLDEWWKGYEPSIHDKKVYGKGLSPTELCMRNGLVSVARATVANRHFCAIYARRIIHIKGYGGDEGIQCELKKMGTAVVPANNNREEDMKNCWYWDW